MNNNPRETLHLTPADFEEVFQDALDSSLRERIAGYRLAYTPCTPEEQEMWIEKVKETLRNPWVTSAGEHRLSQWESGWSENLRALEETKDASAITPHYYGKYNVIRWKQNFITPQSDHFEYYTAAVIKDWLFSKYLKDVSSIYEFGCGTGYNLFLARQANPRAKLYGLDWTRASQEIIRRVIDLGLLSNAEGRQFDFFNPDKNFALDENGGVYTVTSLEQVGGRFVPFIDYLLAKKPRVCIHIEPIEELLDDTNLLDRLSIAYFKKRNYLKGFLAHLRDLEGKGRIVIRRAQRTYLGSLFVEGYSVVVWSPR